MAKYIDVEIKKTIRVDNNDLTEAIKMVKDNLVELVSTPDWLNSQNVTFKENLLINTSAETIARLYSKKFNLKDLKEFIEMVFNKDVKEYILNETLAILKDKYGIDIDNDIKI